PDEKSVTLKAKKDWKLIGKRMSGVDNDKVVTGKPLFGIDQKFPGMLYAVYEKPMAQGATVVTANFDEIKKLPGVKDCFVVQGNQDTEMVMQGVAIICTSTYAGFLAKKQLKVQWDESKASKDNSKALEKQATAIAKERGKDVVIQGGDVNAAFANAAHIVEAHYSYPFLIHPTLEPMNPTAHFHAAIMEL